MFYNQSENKYINEGQQFTLNGVTYPSGWLNQSTPEEKLALGLVEVVKTNQPSNPEFYFVNEELNGAELTYVNEPKDLKGIRERLWEKIKNRRDEVKTNGGCLVQGKWFHSDSDSKQQQIALVIMGANIPANLQWKTLDGSFVTMTQALAGELFAAQVMREQLIFGVAESKRAAIQTMTIEQLEAYDVLDGFPQEYVDEAFIQP
jgi:hypothetical protein